MTTKLTLSIDEAIISSAKKYAEKKGKSLSKLVETYLKTISSGSDENDDISPKIKKLRGSISLPKNFDYKKELGKTIQKRFR